MWAVSKWFTSVNKTLPVFWISHRVSRVSYPMEIDGLELEVGTWQVVYPC